MFADESKLKEFFADIKSIDVTKDNLNNLYRVGKFQHKFKVLREELIKIKQTLDQNISEDELDRMLGHELIEMILPNALSLEQDQNSFT